MGLSKMAKEQLMAEAFVEAKRRKSKGKYIPYGKCKDLQEIQDREVYISGPAGTWKSRACLEKIDWLARTYMNSRYLIVRKTRKSLTESILQTFEDFVLSSEDPVRRGPRRGYRQSYYYNNKSQIVLGGMDNPTRLLSSEYDVIYVPEARELSEDEIESLLTRLRNYKTPYQQLIGDTNPGSPTHWIKQKANQGKAILLNSRHEDNPVLYDHKKGDWTEKGKDYLKTLFSLTGIRLERYAKGLWAAAEGAVYEFDMDVHLINPFAIPENGRRIRVIDFGYTNPFVCQWWYVDGDGRAYLYREIYMTHKTIDVHAELINILSQDEDIEVTICDWDAEERATLEKYGINTIKANKKIIAGIHHVEERLKKAGDDKPRLFLFRDVLVERDEFLVANKKPLCTEQEFEGYIYPKGMDGKPKKETPIDIDNHGMDCMRYLVSYLDGDIVENVQVVSAQRIETYDDNPVLVVAGGRVEENEKLGYGPIVIGR